MKDLLDPSKLTAAAKEQYGLNKALPVAPIPAENSMLTHGAQEHPEEGN
jgi:hypothetical protein